MIIEGEFKLLKKSLFTDGWGQRISFFVCCNRHHHLCCLRSLFLERIVDAHKKNDEAVKQPKSCRKGYMGQVYFERNGSMQGVWTVLNFCFLLQLRLLSNLVMKQKAIDTWMEEFTSQPLWKVTTRCWDAICCYAGMWEERSREDFDGALTGTVLLLRISLRTNWSVSTTSMSGVNRAEAARNRTTTRNIVTKKTFMARLRRRTR